MQNHSYTIKIIIHFIIIFLCIKPYSAFAYAWINDKGLMRLTVSNNSNMITFKNSSGKSYMGKIYSGYFHELKFSQGLLNNIAFQYENTAKLQDINYFTKDKQSYRSKTEMYYTKTGLSLQLLKKKRNALSMSINLHRDIFLGTDFYQNSFKSIKNHKMKRVDYMGCGAAYAYKPPKIFWENFSIPYPKYFEIAYYMKFGAGFGDRLDLKIMFKNGKLSEVGFGFYKVRKRTCTNHKSFDMKSDFSTTIQSFKNTKELCTKCDNIAVYLKLYKTLRKKDISLDLVYDVRKKQIQLLFNRIVKKRWYE